jgi:hypothetical protein
MGQRVTIPGEYLPCLFLLCLAFLLLVELCLEPRETELADDGYRSAHNGHDSGYDRRQDFGVHICSLLMPNGLVRGGALFAVPCTSKVM